MRLRFWMELVLALVTLFLAVITQFWQNWIEVVFRVDPDHGSGSLERMIVGAAALLCVASLLLAGGEWRHSSAGAAVASSPD